MVSSWPVVVAFNLVTAAAYLGITAVILSGLARTGQLRTNRLAVATAAIFTTCAAHHALHGLQFLLGSPAELAMMRSMAITWDVVAVDGLATAAGLVYLGMRRSYGVLLRSPAMFDNASEARYRQLAANLPDTAVLLVDRDMRFLLAEGEGLVGAGLRAGEVEGRLASDVLTGPAFAELEPRLAAALAGRPSDFDSVAGPAGRTFRTRIRPLQESDGEVMGGLILWEDVTAERAAQAELVAAQAFSEAVLDASPDITSIVHLATGRIEWSSRSLRELLGWSREQAVALEPIALAAHVPESDLPRLRAADMEVCELADGESAMFRFRVLDAGGRYRWLSRHITPFGRSADGTVLRGLAVVRDVTEIVDAERHLEHAALHDPLTGLPNRTLLLDRLTSAIARAERNGSEVAVLFCDLDGFKRVNDTDGHSAGDAVLVQVARRLRGVLRRTDSVARVGGDEFVVVLEPGRSDGQAGRVANGAHTVAEMLAGRIRDEMARPIVHEGTSYIISASIGVTFAVAGRPAEDVLRDADIAMYRAKGRGKNRVEVFDDVLRSDLLERSRVEGVLRAALEPGDELPTLSAAYQPVHDLADGRLAGFEALARLTDRQGCAIRPDVFIPVAEDTGLIGALGEAVLEMALAALASWRREHPDVRDVNMAVNLSARQIERSDMYKIVHAGLARHGLDPADLMIEITESVLLEAGSSTMRQVGELRASGVKIAIDDFGTGYASLRYLMNLPISTVKIDKSFTAGIPADRTSATIVRTVAALAAELGLECIVEGIETHQQLASLPPGLLGQGYLLGRPAERPYRSWRISDRVNP